MVDHIRIDGDEVKVVAVNVHGDFNGPIVDADTVRVILAKLPFDEVLQNYRHDDRQFLASVLATASPEEMALVSSVWSAVRAEMPDEAHIVVRRALPEDGVDHAIADAIILKFVRAHRQTALVRSEIADAARSVDSLAKSAERIAKQVAKIAKALEYETSEDINFTAVHANLGSGLIDHIQKMTMAAMAMADMKVWAQRS